MTAYRVIDDHKELDNVGSLTHDQIDSRINTTPFIIVSGAVGDIPPNARLLTGSGVAITDNGPGGTLVLTATGGGGGSPPGGLSTYVQFNDGGIFGGDSSFTFNKSTNTLSVDNLSGSLTRLVDGTSYLIAGNNITIYTGSNGSVTINSTASGSGTPGGLDTYVQFNDGGSFGGDSGFTFDKTTKTLTVDSLTGSLTKLSDGSSYLVAGSNVVISTGSNGAVTISVPASNQISQVSWMELPSGDADGVNMVFTLTQSPFPSNSLMFYVNGILQLQGLIHDYDLSGSTVIMNYSPASGSNISATYAYVTTPPVGMNTLWMDVPAGLVDGSNNIFTLAYAPMPTSALMFYVNGVLQRQGATADYTASGNTVTMNYVPNSGSNIVATYPY